MKKIISLLLVITALFTLAVPVFAAEIEKPGVSDADEVIYLDDGSYITTTLVVEDSDIAPASTTYSKTGTKYVTNRSEDGDILWQYFLTANFSIEEGVLATCISATYTKSISSIYWNFYDGNAYVVNNIAHGVGVFKKKVLLVTVATYDIHITISCDAYGNLD